MESSICARDELDELGVVALPVTERLFLWAIRAWSAYHSDLTAVWWSLDRAFKQEGIAPALPHFHRLMSDLFVGFKRWPDIRCVGCPRLGKDEARLLAAFARLQTRDLAGARSELQELALRSTARAVCEGAQQCVLIANSAGVHFAALETFALCDGGIERSEAGLQLDSRINH